MKGESSMKATTKLALEYLKKNKKRSLANIVRNYVSNNNYCMRSYNFI